MAVAARLDVAFVAFTSTMGMVGIHMRNPRAIVAADRPIKVAVRNMMDDDDDDDDEIEELELL